MSADRLLPTAPGWWWGRINDEDAPRHIVWQSGDLVVLRGWIVIGPVTEEAWTWLEPIPAPGVVAALTAERDLAQAAVRAFGEILNGAAVYRSDHAPARTMIVDPETFAGLKSMFPG